MSGFFQGPRQKEPGSSGFSDDATSRVTPPSSNQVQTHFVPKNQPRINSHDFDVKL